MLEASEKSTSARVISARTRIVVASMLTVTSWMCPFPSSRPAATNSIGALTPVRSSGRASTAHPNTSAARAMIAPSLIDRPRSEASGLPVRRLVGLPVRGPVRDPVGYRGRSRRGAAAVDVPPRSVPVPLPVPSGSSTPVRRAILAHGLRISREGMPRARHPYARGAKSTM